MNQGSKGKPASSSRSKTTSKPIPSVEELLALPNVTLSEAARIMRVDRGKVRRLCTTKQLRWFYEGQYMRVVTASILDRQQRLVEQTGGAA